jgi:hypothetical protein
MEDLERALTKIKGAPQTWNEDTVDRADGLFHKRKSLMQNVGKVLNLIQCFAK